MSGWLALALAAAVVQTPAQDEVRVHAKLSATSVVTGATVVLEVRVETPGVRPVRVNLPPLPPSISIVGTQDFTHDQIQLPGGRVRIVQRNVILLPERPGTFLIPTIPVEVDGTTYRTAPLQLEVLAGGQPPPSSLPAIDLEDIRLSAQLDRSTVYVGEQVVLEVEALFPREMRQRQTRPATFETPNPPGFWVAELPGGLTGGVRLFRGDYYETQRYRRVYVPLEPGHYVLDPVRLQYEIRRGHLYASEQREQVSDSLRLRVLPLPEQNRPGSFTGAVGRYRATARLQPASVTAGDATTLSFEITGTGNVKTLPPPRLPELEGVEIFPPSEDAEVSVRGDQLGGTKRFTWVLVPEQEGRIDLGAIEYAFFDPETNAYGVSRADPLALDVAGATRPANADAADTALARILATPHSRDLGFVRSPFFVGAQAVPLFALLAVLFLRRRRAAPQTVRREQRARWEAALDEVAADSGGDARAFLGRLAAVVRTALAERTGITRLRASPADSLRTELEAAGISTYSATAAAALVRRLDHARFAGSATDAPARDRLIAEARSVLERVERDAPSAAGPATGALVLVFALSMPAALAAQSAGDTFRTGVGTYLQGDYASAVAAFETHLEGQPADAAAWYNLGNAYRGTGDTGRAVWAWRRALELDPRSGATRRNLRLTGGDAALAGAPPPFALTGLEAGLLLGACWWIAAGALAFAVLRNARRARHVALGAAVLALLVLGAGAHTLLRGGSAVALAGRTPLLAGPAVRSDTVAVVPAGTPVRIVGREGGWLRVRTSDRAEGWGTPEGFAEVAPAG